MSIPEEEYREKLLDALAQLRKRCHVPEGCQRPKWNDELAKNAAAAASACRRAGKVFSSNCPRQGQCLSFKHQQGSGNMFTPKDPDLDKTFWVSALQQWFSERRNWKQQTFDGNPGPVGNFTQLTWFDMKEVGAALAYEKQGFNLKVYTVFNFSPPGNVTSGTVFKANTPNPQIVEKC
eukprot:Selendium_serpulae@DN4397_c0_g1_i4.p1